MKTRQYVTAETLTDGATPSIITRYHTNVYKTQCGFPSKKSQQIHAKIKRYLIINELQDSPWHRPAAAPTKVSVSGVTYCNINPESYLSNFRGSCHLFTLLFLCPLVRKEISECLDRSPIRHF